MNCYTRKEKIMMAIDDVMTKVKMAVEITVIVAGVVAMGLIAFMNQKLTTLETELNYYKEHVQEEDEERLIIKDPVTGRVIYDQPR